MLETTTQFPVVPGTVVEVKCSDSEAFHLGSSEVICATQTGFIYSEEPRCLIAGINCSIEFFRCLQNIWTHTHCYLMQYHLSHPSNSFTDGEEVFMLIKSEVS